MDSPLVAIIGKPNSGKSLLFNRLTGLNQKVTNFPGITVDVKKGQHQNLTIADFPGIYSFNALTQDEIVAVRKFIKNLEEGRISKVLCVLDGTNLNASLRVGLEVLHKASQKNVPVIFAVNMIDELSNNKLTIDMNGLSERLKSPVVAISAKTGEGVTDLDELLHSDLRAAPVHNNFDFSGQSLILSKEYGPQTDILFLKQTRVDRFLLSPVLGGIFFVGVMLVLFQAIFSWSVPFMDLIEGAIAFLADLVSSKIPDGILKDFINEALFGGLGSFLVFVPQIFFLTLIVGFLEDSGYLARAAMICHKPLKYFGLSGKSFIPMLTGHACAIPAIMAARTVESGRRRFMTILITPLMSCSARLPVYALLVAVLIPNKTYLGGLIGLQGLSFFGLYLLGLIVALIVSFILSQTNLKKEQDSAFLLELPPYRLPSVKPLLNKSFKSAQSFVVEAGFIIFAVTLIVWCLGYFPNGSGQMESSYLAHLGRFIEPILSPLDLDWRYGVAILVSFLAREVFVGTLGTIYGIESADENILGLTEHIQNSGLSLASGVALLVFYAIALQCVSTLAVIKKELGSFQIPVYLFLGYSLLAYLLALFAYNLF